MTEPKAIVKQRGGYRPGSGRLSKKEQEDIKVAIRKALSKDKKQLTRIWKKILDKAEDGSIKHIEIFFNYYYGKPTESVMVQTKQMIVKRVIISTDANADSNG